MTGPKRMRPESAEADPELAVSYVVEPERRMSELSVDRPQSAVTSGRRSARGNWHNRLRIGIMGGTFDISSTGKKGKSIKVDGISKKAEGANVTTNPSYYFDFII